MTAPAPETAPAAGADAGADRITLQRVIFPENGICTEQDLYFHFAGPAGYYDHPRGALLAEAGTTVLLDSYFNALSIGKWHESCTIDGLWLALAGEGTVELKVWHAIPDRSWEVLASQVMTLTADEALIDLSHYAENATTGLVWFEWRPAGGRNSAAAMTGARYLTRAPAGPLPRLAICITTFRREAAVARTVARLEAFLAGFRWGGNIRVVVVDNGQSAAIPPSDHVLAVPNPNLGGAGGFARGLIEAEARGATHCLFMDDDASFHMENVARTYAFLALARDPKAALAGAMINNTHKWAMWENGAVFDRSCIPLYCGLDLRRRENVIHLEFTSPRERRKTLYGGWWYFAFPVAAVTRRPFPFFVRGDDVSFSIANRFRIVTLNGVVSFQDDFTEKESPQTLYLDLRSHLVHHLVFDAIDRGGWGTAKVALRFIGRSLARFHYETAAAQMLAWEDVMRGPAFFRDHADMADRRAVLRALARTEAWGPLDDLDLTERRRFTRRGRIAARLFALTVNGHLLPFFGLWGDRIVLPVAERGTLHPAWGAARITYLDGTRTKGYTVAQSKRRFLAAAWRAGTLALRFRRAFPALRAEYRAAYPQMTALPFWQDLLGIGPPTPPASAPRPQPATGTGAEGAMVRDLVIHIGDPKTGSTAIQTVLATGGWSAPGLTALYPAKVNHLPLARCLYLPAEAGERAARWRAVAARIAAADADVAVISAELFERADPARLAATLAEFLPDLAPRARIVGYVRPHAERLVAAWAERTKQGDTTLDLAGFFARAQDQFRYAPRLARWRAVFGDRLTIRPFIRDRLAGGDVVADFLGIVAGGRPVTVTRPASANESLTLADLAMLRAFHLRVAGRQRLAAARRAVGWNLAQYLAGLPQAPGAGAKPRLHRALAPAVAAAYAEDAAAVDAAVFGGTPTLVPALAAAVAGAAEAAPSLDPADHFGPEALRLIGVWAAMAATMLEHDPDLIPAHFRARQQAALAGDDPSGPRRRPGAGPKGRGGGEGAGPAALPDAALAALLPPGLRRRKGPTGRGRTGARGA